MVSKRELPIQEIARELESVLKKRPSVVICAPTGSGKSTQVPQMLLDRGLVSNGRIVVLQPRRIAARMLATRVAWERDGRLGEEVGYQVRFENRSGAKTRIIYQTDGILLRQLVHDPDLHDVGAIVFDEFHERHLYGDVMLALARKLQQRRPELKLVVMSATLDSKSVSAYLDDAPVVQSSGRMYPVDIEYLARTPDPDRDPPWELAAREFERVSAEQAVGDTLIFMPGAYEIRRTISALSGTRAGRGCIVLPLHGELANQDQDAVFKDYQQRKVIVATNVAETSLTIDGIGLVIDSGLARKAKFDPNRGINTLLIEKISRASADQRAGRAGRTSEGRCIRLWTEKEHVSRQAQELPEIRRVDLSETLLQLKAMGILAVASFPWLDSPDEKAINHAVEFLEDIGALAPAGGPITSLGRQMLAFPIHPRHARMLIEAANRKCIPTVALMAALTQENQLLIRGVEKDTKEKRENSLGDEGESDLFLMAKAWTHARDNGYDVDACRRLGIHARGARQAGRTYEQFIGIAESEGLDLHEDQKNIRINIRKCILAGFADRLARRAGTASNRYEAVHHRRGALDKDTCVKGSELIVSAEMQEIGRASGEVEVKMSIITAVEKGWLQELFPEELSSERCVFYDESQKRVKAEERSMFRDLVLERGKIVEATDQEAAKLLAGEVEAGRATLKAWDDTVEQWVTRLNRLCDWCPELNLPLLHAEDRRHLYEQICLGARSLKDIKEKPVWPHVRSWLSAAQQAVLEKQAPERAKLSNGRTPKIIYDKVNPPFISVQIQQLYGVKDKPSIAMGRVRLLVHILAPSQRPVQVTDDLVSFWKNSYPQVKKELQRKYPKHEWR